MTKFICASAAGTVFSLDVAPVTHRMAFERAQALFEAHKGPAPTSRQLALLVTAPDEEDGYATYNKAAELANGCGCYAANSLRADDLLAGRA